MIEARQQQRKEIGHKLCNGWPVDSDGAVSEMQRRRASRESPKLAQWTY